LTHIFPPDCIGGLIHPDSRLPKHWRSRRIPFRLHHGKGFHFFVDIIIAEVLALTWSTTLVLFDLHSKKNSNISPPRDRESIKSTNSRQNERITQDIQVILTNSRQYQFRETESLENPQFPRNFNSERPRVNISRQNSRQLSFKATHNERIKT
jgi:hypothetical protein